MLDLFGEETKPLESVCGKCAHFGKVTEWNCGPCLINAYGDGLPLHRRYKSACPKYSYSKAAALALTRSEGGMHPEDKRLWRDPAKKIAQTILTVAVMALAGCGSSMPAPKASPAEIFALRTECGKMGEAWLMRHPLKENQGATGSAEAFYDSSSNRCWLITTYWIYNYQIQAGQSQRAWPAWVRHKIWKDVTDETRTLYDAQTGARVKTCRFLDGEEFYRDGDCAYIKKVEASDL